MQKGYRLVEFIIGDKDIDSSRESNSFYDVFNVSEEHLKECKWILGIESDKTSDELFEKLQNR